MNKDLKEKLVKQKQEIEKQKDINEKNEIKNKAVIDENNKLIQKFATLKQRSDIIKDNYEQYKDWVNDQDL